MFFVLNGFVLSCLMVNKDIFVSVCECANDEI